MCQILKHDQVITRVKSLRLLRFVLLQQAKAAADAFVEEEGLHEDPETRKANKALYMRFYRSIRSNLTTICFLRSFFICKTNLEGP